MKFKHKRFEELVELIYKYPHNCEDISLPGIEYCKECEIIRGLKRSQLIWFTDSITPEEAEKKLMIEIFGRCKNHSYQKMMCDCDE